MKSKKTNVKVAVSNRPNQKFDINIFNEVTGYTTTHQVTQEQILSLINK